MLCILQCMYIIACTSKGKNIQGYRFKKPHAHRSVKALDPTSALTCHSNNSRTALLFKVHYHSHRAEWRLLLLSFYHFIYFYSVFAASGEVTGKSIKAHASISKLYSSTAGTVDHIKGGIGLDFYYFWYSDSCMLFTGVRLDFLFIYFLLITPFPSSNSKDIGNGFTNIFPSVPS